MTQLESVQSEATRAAWLGQNHGYRIAGDVACLNAELAVSRDDVSARAWSLQLWACEEPYRGGELQGTKVAEAMLDLRAADSAQPQHLYAETFARLPAGDRDYSMVLVLAERGAHDEVYDFANYPAREHFNVPSLRGEVSSERTSEGLTLRVERIENPRGGENLSGSLALELWALREPYRGGQFQGQPVAGVEIGRLEGQHGLDAWEQQLVCSPAPSDHPCLTLMLREWTATGYVTRDYRALANVPVAPAAAMTAKPEREDATAASVLSDSGTFAPVAPAQPVVAEPAAPSCLVSIQHATVQELAAVPGLNRKLAAEIIKARPYTSFEQLLRVRGIGDKTLRKLRSVLSV